MHRNKNKSLLIIEDSDEDFEVLQILMEDMDVTWPVYRCKTGDLALEFIHQCKLPSETGRSSRPSMILLDLNLPGIDGREVLEALKQDEEFKAIPVVVFTTSSDQNDVHFCYQNGANGYLIKPVNMDLLEKKVQAFVSYWLDENTTDEWNGVNLMAQ